MAEEEREKKRKMACLNDPDQLAREEVKCIVGMVTVTKTDGILNDPHVVGKFVGRKMGNVQSVKATRNGMVTV